MKIYHYDCETGEYAGEGIADKDPLEKDKWLIPAYATTIEPVLSRTINDTTIFRDGVWEIVQNNRGTKYWDADGNEFKTTKLNEKIPDDCTFEKPQKSREQLEREIKEAVHLHHHHVAIKCGYFSLINCTTYVGFENEYQGECVKLLKWASDCWPIVFDAMKTDELPSAEEIIKLLPEFK